MNGKSYPSKLIRNLSNNHAEPIGHNVEGRADSQTAIDPLSHVCLTQVNPTAVPQYN